jgi:hypothetical protein
MVDTYGTGQAPYCHPATRGLRNRLGLTSDAALNRAERSLSEIAASESSSAAWAGPSLSVRRVSRERASASALAGAPSVCVRVSNATPTAPYTRAIASLPPTP